MTTEATQASVSTCVAKECTSSSSLRIFDTDSQCTQRSSSALSAKNSRDTKAARCEGFEARCNDPKTVVDYLSVLKVIGGLPAVILYDILANMVATSEKRRPFRDTALDSVMGHCYRSSTLRQLRIMTGVRPLRQEFSNVLYKWGGYTRKLKNFNREFHSETSDFAARWVHEVPDRTPEDPVLLYFHGGGYSLKTCQPQVQYICELAKVLRKQRVNVLVLDYTIAPFATYPIQRNQALACINKLQESCSNIILFGDSCGANLVLSVLQEEKGTYAIDNSRMLGCVLVSPWVDPGAQTGSMNSKRDILSKSKLNEMTANFVTKDQLKDPLVTPLRAHPDTWKRVLPKNTCCVWGDLECLADQCIEFQKVANVTNYFIERNGTHDCILRGLSPAPCQYITRQILDWTAAAEPKAGLVQDRPRLDSVETPRSIDTASSSKLDR